MTSNKHDLSYFSKCMMGGSLACGLSHWALTPIDIVKCRKQIYPDRYRSYQQGLQAIVAKEGYRGLALGWFPTLAGYGMQGSVRFGLYELFKDVFKYALGAERAIQYQNLGFMLSAASAEFLADLFLCPWEALKVKMQVAELGTFPRTAREGAIKMMNEGGVAGFYKGLIPLWGRQVPYTVVKFTMFENTVNFVYRKLLMAPKESYSKST